MRINQAYDLFIKTIEDMETKEIANFLAMGVIYLQKEKQIDFKTIIKHFNNCNEKANLRKRVIVCI